MVAGVALGARSQPRRVEVCCRNGCLCEIGSGLGSDGRQPRVRLQHASSVTWSLFELQM